MSGFYVYFLGQSSMWKLKITHWCISCDKVLEIQQMIPDQVCVEYQQSGIACPCQLQGNIFPTTVINNLDYNLLTAKAQS